jgi:hypothetical protein
MNLKIVKQACRNLGLEEPISIEPDGTVWTGLFEERVYADMDVVNAEIARIESENSAAKQAVLDRLGITAEEARLLLS